jgi:hypothetical protein
MLNNQITTHKLTLGRFEGDIAVLAGEFKLDIPKKILPKEAKEGDALVVTIATNEAETKRKTQRAKDLLNEILNNK